MLRDRPLDLPSLAAAAVTLLLTMLTAAGAAEGAAPQWRGLALLAALPAPFIVAVAWGWAVLRSGGPGPVLLAAAGWLGLSLLWTSEWAALSMLGNVAAGGAAGWALKLGWRTDAALAAVTAALLPLVVWSAVQLPAAEQMDAVSQQFLEVLEQNLPEGADDQQRQEALARERENLERVAAVALRIYPAFIGLGVIGQAAVVLALLRLLARWRRAAVKPLGWPPFTRWRLPFYVVWVLVAGLGMMITRQPPLADAGLNIVLLAALAVSVQGLAVQAHATQRLLAPPLRVAFWLGMGLLFFPLLAGSILLGLLDQWWDIRRLDAAADETDGS